MTCSCPQSGVATAREVLLEAELISAEPASLPVVAPVHLLLGLLAALAVGAADRLGAVAAPLSAGLSLPRRAGPGACATPPRCGPAGGRRTRRPAPGAARAGRAGRRTLRLPRSPCSRASRSITVPPSSRASRTPGGKLGRPPSCRRRAIAGRACSVWPANHRAAPSSSHAQRSSARSRAGAGRRGRSRLLSAITRRAYSAVAVSSSISRDPGTAGRPRARAPPGRACAARARPAQPRQVAARRRRGRSTTPAAPRAARARATWCCGAARPSAPRA